MLQFYRNEPQIFPLPQNSLIFFSNQTKTAIQFAFQLLNVCIAILNACQCLTDMKVPTWTTPPIPRKPMNTKNKYIRINKTNSWLNLHIIKQEGYICILKISDFREGYFTNVMLVLVHALCLCHDRRFHIFKI